MTRYPIPAGEARAKLTVMNSRFIVSASPAFSVEQAKDYITRIKAEFPDASHHVPIYLIGFGNSVIAHCSDAGEPSGTAGRPALAVLQGSGLGDIVVVITRYFGGAKLGTGGLVRAYSDSVRAVLAVLPRAIRIPTHTVRVTLPYSFYESSLLLIRKNKGERLNEDFGEDVTFILRFPVEDFETFQEALRELTRGGITAEIVESHQDTIFPL